ncbi:MAG: DUF1007 family protein [Spirochaetales bacterium]|nr:DUF1007 family protein [Spirochaetales bacterium]
MKVKTIIKKLVFWRNYINFHKLMVLFLFFIINISAFSHPHVFIENAFTFVFNETGLDVIKIKWIFDEMFSASIILDYDLNQNNIFEKNEIKAVKEEAFSNLENYNYFLHINYDNSDLTISSVSDFNAEILNNRIIYYFSVSLDYKAEIKEKIVTAGSYDETYFCHVFNSENDPITLENDSLFECSWEIIEDKKNIYWVTIIPKAVVLKFRKKNE